MTHIRFHSDCDYFAGCENMLANFFNDERLAGGYKVSFSHRASPAYEEGFQSRVPKAPKMVPVPVLDFHQVSGLSNDWPAPLRVVFKSLTRVLLVKYWMLLWDVACLYRSMGGEKIDILQINNGGWPGAVSCLAAPIAARLRGIKTIVHVVNNLPVPYDGPDRWLDWPLDVLAARATSLFVTGSEAARGCVVRVLRVPDAKVVSLPNGIAPRPLLESEEALRARLGAVDGRPLIAVIAVLEPRKGHAVLLEALALLKAEGLTPFPVTAIGGDGSIEDELKALCRSLKLEDDVKFLGWENRHFDLFHTADVVVLPSTEFEDFPNVTIEAMGLGRAVVASKVGGVEEQLVDGESGILTKPNDAEDLARALKTLCQDRALRERLGRKALERFKEHYTAEGSVDRYIKLYRSILTGAAR